MAVQIGFQDFEVLRARIESINYKSKKILEQTIADYKRRMPGWIAEEVVKEYNITASGRALKKMQSIGGVSVYGSSLDTGIKFSGRALSAHHFGMTPNKVKAYKKLGKRKRKNIPGGGIQFQGKAGPVATMSRMPATYDITVEIHKGQREKLKGEYDTPWFLAKAKNGVVLPFQRKPDNKITSATTTSLPQMVSYDKVTLKPYIADAIRPDMEKRLNHYIDRNMRRF